jgi:thymidylate synthase
MNKWSNYGKWRHTELYKQLTQMNKLDKTYQDLLQDILDNGVEKKDRTGTGTISVFGRQIRHNMKDGFPLLTTKRMPFKTIVTELLWFLRGDTNIKYLVDNDCHIWTGDAKKNYDKHFSKYWTSGDNSSKYDNISNEEFEKRIKTDDEFAKKWGELGPTYGKQWRKWKRPNHIKEGSTYYSEIGNFNNFRQDIYNEHKSHFEIDQIQNLINDLKTNPDSRRLMVNAWNCSELDQMVLPPCHYGFQVYTRELSFNSRYRLGNYQPYNIKGKVECEKGLDYITQEQFESFHHKKMDELNIPTRTISLMWNQRSVDTFLGLPFNIASYGLLLEIIAKEVNMVPDELIGNLGDVHLYSNHIEQAKEQIGRKYTHEERTELLKQAMGEENYNKAVDELMPFGGGLSEYYDLHKIPNKTREPYKLPTFDCPAMDEIPYNTFDELVFKLQPADFYMDDYVSHPTIKAPLSN